jgi:hypothetical protein
VTDAKGDDSMEATVIQRERPGGARIAGICGLAAFVTFNIGWIGGGLAQPAAYSFANDDISDVGAVTASSSWIQNRVGSNLTGLLVVALHSGSGGP